MSADQLCHAALRQAAEEIMASDAILIGAGAGMGVDSGLPDFRGDAGFWNSYPAFNNKNYTELSNPDWFRSDPRQAWGFYGHRLNLYRSTDPHPGFTIVLKWAQQRPAGYFVFTSNVDGHFQRAGFSEEWLLEFHGSIEYLQCSAGCTSEVWSVDDLVVTVDEETKLAVSELPTCVRCRAVARPNLLMFGDCEWNTQRFEIQRRRFSQWIDSVVSKRLVTVEFGAGSTIPSVRQICEGQEGTLIRVNPSEAQGPPGTISLALTAFAAIREIDTFM